MNRKTEHFVNKQHQKCDFPAKHIQQNKAKLSINIRQIIKQQNIKDDRVRPGPKKSLLKVVHQ